MRENFVVKDKIRVKEGIDIFLLDFELNKIQIKSGNLPKSQLESIGRYKFIKDKEKRILARLFLNFFISKKYGVNDTDIVFNEFQKPFLKSNSGLEFSFSYSKDYLLIAISKVGRVGVDIEFVNNTMEIEPLAMEIMCGKELTYFKNLSSNKALQRKYFFELFSTKESIIKAFGTGLYFPVKELNTIDQNYFKYKKACFQQLGLKSSLNKYATSVCFEKK